MRQTFEIPGRFCSLNDFIGMSYHDQNDAKARYDNLVALSARCARIKPYNSRIRYHVLWVEQNRKRDLDNVAFGKKFIQDGLIKAGIIRNDTHHEIAGFSDEFAYDSKNPRIVVTIEEA